MEHSERLRLRRLHQQTERETDSARSKFPAHKAVETLPIAYGMTALIEEIGKLARCFNKLVIAEEERIVQGWHEEANNRVITCMSLLERMHVRGYGSAQTSLTAPESGC